MARGKQAETPTQLPAPAPTPSSIKARVLVTGVFGNADDVVELHPDALALGVAAGHIDPHPDAVAYAASLK